MPSPPPALLGSWKEIAQYMGKGVRTVQRWERQDGLPVHRPAANSKGPVLAYPAELSDWIHHRPHVDAGRSGDSETRHRELVNEALTLAKCWRQRGAELLHLKDELHRLKVETIQLSRRIMEQHRAFRSKSKG